MDFQNCHADRDLDNTRQEPSLFNIYTILGILEHDACRYIARGVRFMFHESSPHSFPPVPPQALPESEGRPPIPAAPKAVTRDPGRMRKRYATALRSVPCHTRGVLSNPQLDALVDLD
jgi:hypothetical protein